MLIELMHDLIVSTDQIAEIEEVPTGKPRGRIKVTFGDGRTRYLDRSIDGLRGYVGTVLPAPPGYSVIYGSTEGDVTTFRSDAVIAFRYEGVSIGGPLAPITDEGEPSEFATWALVKPDGSVTDFDRTYEGLDAYMEEITRQAKSNPPA